MPPGSASGRPVPLRFPSPQNFLQVRDALRAAGYDDAGVCRHLGIGSMFEFVLQSPDRRAGTELRDPVDALIRLLMDGEVLEESRLRPVVAPELLDGLEALGVLARTENDPNFLYGAVLLYPMGSFYLASDRSESVDRKPLPEDAVYLGITRSAQLFLSGLPQAPCEDLLDLCTGSGIAALLGAARARRVQACDLAGRSVCFAEFNCRLNGIGNVTCGQGDLYAPVEGLTFDRIVAHPPYVPSGGPKFLYRDGGSDGEQLMRRIVEGLPSHLRPGGRYYAFGMGTDRAGDPFERRIRRWLGEHSAEFDVLVVARELREKRADKIWLRDALIPEDFDPRLQVKAVVLATIVIERIARPRPAATARTLAAPNAASDAIEWFAHWHTHAAAPGFESFLLDSRPRIAAHFRLRVEHAPVAGALAPASFELRSDYPFSVAAPCPGWLAMVVGACDGKRTVREIFEKLRGERALAPDATPEGLARDVREMISRGFLELEEFPLPVLKNLHA